MSELHDHLLDFVLGHLHAESPGRAAEIEAGLERDPSLRAEHDLLVEAVTGVALMAEPAQRDAVETLRARVLGDVDAAPAQRFAPLLDKFAELFDVAVCTAEQYLGCLTEPGAMKPLLPGLSFCDFEGGPATAGQTVGIVQVEPGKTFPNHRHLGTERVLILQGKSRDEDGNEYRAGDLIVSEAGTAHDVPSIGDEPLVYAVVVQGIKIEP